MLVLGAVNIFGSCAQFIDFQDPKVGKIFLIFDNKLFPQVYSISTFNQFIDFFNILQPLCLGGGGGGGGA